MSHIIIPSPQFLEYTNMNHSRAEHRHEEEPQGSFKKIHYTKDTPPNEESSSPGALDKFLKNAHSIQALHKKGIKELFPIQYKTFKIIYEGEDIIAKDRTGSGKTLAFSLPIIERLRDQKEFGRSKTPLMLIVLPTR